jgi:hypothetical protein
VDRSRCKYSRRACGFAPSSSAHHLSAKARPATPSHKLAAPITIRLGVVLSFLLLGPPLDIHHGSQIKDRSGGICRVLDTSSGYVARSLVLRPMGRKSDRYYCFAPRFCRGLSTLWSISCLNPDKRCWCAEPFGSRPISVANRLSSALAFGVRSDMSSYIAHRMSLSSSMKFSTLRTDPSALLRSGWRDTTCIRASQNRTSSSPYWPDQLCLIDFSTTGIEERAPLLHNCSRAQCAAGSRSLTVRSRNSSFNRGSAIWLRSAFASASWTAGQICSVVSAPMSARLRFLRKFTASCRSVSPIARNAQRELRERCTLAFETLP